MIEKQTLKTRAFDLCRTARPSLILAGVLFTLFSLVVSSLSARIMSSGFTERDVQRFMEAYYSGDYEYALSISSKFQPSPAGVLVDTALQIALMIVSAGFIIFVLNTIRNTEANYGNLLDGFGIAGKVILLNVLEGLFILLWSLLLVVPGIIAAYRYRQAVYILIDNPEKTVMQCIRESKQMMDGHKAELFWLDLSMIGWLLMDMFIPFASVWTTPYTNTVWGLYYEQLSGKGQPALREGQRVFYN